MGITTYLLFLMCLNILHCYAINCRTDGGPKEAVLKDIYTKCMKLQDEKATNATNSSKVQDWREPKGHNRPDRGKINDDKGWNQKDNSDIENNRSNNDRSNNNWSNNGGSHKHDNNRHRDNKNDQDGKNDRHSNSDDRMRRNDMMNNFDSKYGRNDHISTRDGFQNDDFGGDLYNNYQSSSPPYRRYKREKHNKNSGNRSQYNPNKSSHEENVRNEENNSSENNSSKEANEKACALHCFLENLKMTNGEGRPDKYLVTHAITKEVKNEDLKDFLQEAVEECFQMLENENTDENCEFSKNLLMCLSEKGRANCDDWKDDLRF